MSGLSLLTIVKGRREHLENLLRGVALQRRAPDEVIVVFMNEEPSDKLPDPGCKIYLESHFDPQNPLPLAAARNRAAGLAAGQILAFLDVDCIPAPDYLEQLEKAVRQTHGLVMGDVRYLGAGDATPPWTPDQLEARAQPHPRRPLLPADRDLISLPYHLFWSLSFGLRATDFARLGGFDRGYHGYGGEDTDFSFSARKVRLPLFACRARAYHQFHPSYSPPFNHLEDIVANAERFHDKWQVWPMDGWLKKFAEAGYIEWRDDSIRLLRTPDPAAIDAARTDSPWG